MDNTKKPVKTCSCCQKVYESIPQEATDHETGYYYNCTCRSTLFWRKPDEENINIQFEKEVR